MPEAQDRRRRAGRLDGIDQALWVAVALLVPYGLHLIFRIVPTEEKMGVVQRIFYFHVPSAFMGFLGVGLCALCSALYLWKRQRRYDLVAHASAEIAVVFFTIVLLTGPIWARPVWGVWWTGEVRLTSTLVLWLMYVGYLVLRRSAENPDQEARWGAVLGIVGALDLPIIYKSVEWWRGLHPKVLKVSGGQGLDPVMERGLLVCSIAFVLLFALLLVQRCRAGALEDELAALTRRLAGRGPGAEPA